MARRVSVASDIRYAEPVASAEIAGLRVLLLNYEYPPIGGGAGVATEALARGLAAGGAEVEVVTGGTSAAMEPVEIVHGERGGRVAVHRVRSDRKGVHQAGMLNAAGYVRAAIPVVRDLVAGRRYDVVHCFFSLPTGLILPFARLADTPVVMSLRGSDVPGYDSTARNLQRVHRALRPLTRWLWRRADRVVAVCDSLGRLALRTDPALRYDVIGNGVDTTLFHPPTAPRPIRVDSVRCVAVARLMERKGLPELLHALGRLERGRFELDIIGGGRDEAILRGLALQLGLTDEVRFLGALDREATAARLRDADLFVLPSRDEAFGNVFAEALASGLPIVGTDVGGIPDLVTSGENGLLVPPSDPAALAEAIVQLADDPVRRSAMRRRNREKAERELGWDTVVQRYAGLYRSLRASSRSRHLTLAPSSAVASRPAL